MERRTFVAGIGTLAAGAALAASVAEAQERKAAVPATKDGKALDAIRESTASCLTTGQICLARCVDHLQAGIPSMADCQRAVMNMLAVTEAMNKAASYRNADAKLLKSLAQTCAEFCRACEKSCAVHAEHHSECKACMEACRGCAKACDEYQRA